MKPKTALVLIVFFVPLIFVSASCSHNDKLDETRRSASFVSFNDNDRGWLGVSIDDVTPKLVKKKNLKVEVGVYVTNVADDSPAEIAGMKEGDVILEFDGKKITGTDDLITDVRETKPGTKVSIVILRDGEKMNFDITIEELPRPRSFSLRIPPIPPVHPAPHFSFLSHTGLYGLTLEELDKQLGEYFGAPNGKGILVKNVKRKSEGEIAGFKAGDVIVKIGKESIGDLDDVWSALEDYNTGDKADVEVLRKGVTQKLTLVIEDRERGLSFRHFNGEDDVIVNLIPHEEGKRFRKEAEQLRRELENMKHSLRDSMLELKYKLKREFDRVRRTVNV